MDYTVNTCINELQFFYIYYVIRAFLGRRLLDVDCSRHASFLDPVTFIFDLDRSILKIYLRTEMNFVGQGL